MSNISREKLIKHGQIITGFTNEEYPDDAVRSYFDNLSIFLDSPSDFKTKIEKLFPYLDNFENSLTSIDRKLLVLALVVETTEAYLNKQLKMIGWELDHCLPESNTLMLFRFSHEYRVVDGDPDITPHYDGPHPVKIRDLSDEIEGTLDPNIYKQTDMLMILKSEIKRSLKKASEHVKNNLLSVAKQYDDIKTLHVNLQNLQSDYWKIMVAVTNQKQLKKIPEVNHFLKEYNSLDRNKLAISNENSLVEIPPVGEKRYLKERNPGQWYQIMKQDLTYVLIKFFRIENSSKYIRRCSVCRIFFISSKIDPRIKYCSKCSPKCKMSREERREYQKQWNLNKKEQKLAIEREAQINTLMKRSGYSREEVVKIVEEDSEL